MEYRPYVNTVEKAMLRRAAIAGRPINGSLELLPLCNMNCDMCYIRLSRSEMEKKGRLRTADEWIRLGDQMTRSGVLFLLLTGGEPLLFPDFKRLYLELRQRGMILTINTNGTLVDEEWADLFGKYKPRRINVTLYGADNEAYERLCHYPGGFEKALKGVQLLRRQGVDVKINGSVTKENRKDMSSIYRIGKKFGVPVHMDTYMLPGLHESGKSIGEQARLSPEDAAEAEFEAMREELSSDAFSLYVQTKLAQLEDNDIRYPTGVSCMAGNCSFTVNWQGEMRPCVSLSEPASDVFEVGFETAWRNISAGIKEICFSSKCGTCSWRSVCKICVASAGLETGKYNGTPEYLCEYAKKYAELLQTYKENI